VMPFTCRALSFTVGMLLFLQPSVFADLLDFEGFPDSTPITTQYPGVTFSHATILTAGISLNEFEFPPHSGVNVVFDDGGPMSLSFASPIFSFSGYFTYLEPLTLLAFDAGSSQVAQANSLFSDNLALSGDPGSSPNEFLHVSFAGGISSVTITGDPGGSSFTLDDATIDSTPEPSSVILLLTVLAALAAMNRFRRERPQPINSRSSSHS
jgi:hypothetical protein